MRSPVTSKASPIDPHKRACDRSRHSTLAETSAWKCGNRSNTYENGVRESSRAPNRKRKETTIMHINHLMDFGAAPKKSCAKFNLGLEEKLRMTKIALK